MAEFLTTNGISCEIEKIINESKTYLWLVSPYLQISKTLYERLKDASDRNVAIWIVTGKSVLKPNTMELLAELKNIRLHYFENLHAKCYYNENKMVITSMNLYEFSEKTNREMGVLIDSQNDKNVFDKAFEEAVSIFKNAERMVLKKTDSSAYIDKKQEDKKTSASDKKPVLSYCIRCEKSIFHNLNRPYCDDCFSSWANFKNPYQRENVCHDCGKPARTRINKPQCRNCYKQNQKKQWLRFS